jgi:hypothetical protein
MDCYVRVNDNLRHLTLAAEDWAAIEIVAEWLQLFRTATTLMLSSKDTTILWVHICFTCLQDHIRRKLAGLGSGVPQQLKHGLVEAHMKLGEYMKLLDSSPYYLWATCEFQLLRVLRPLIYHTCLVLDPCFMYSGMLERYKDEHRERHLGIKRSFCVSLP